MILIVDMNWKRDSLAQYEFVLPIVSVVQPLEECRIKHFSEVAPKDLADCSRVVLSGTALKDHTTLKEPEKFSWIKTFDKPLFGICAGMQTVGLVFDMKLTPCLHVGMTEITVIKKNPLFESNFSAYTLHNYSVRPPKNFEVIAESSKCIQAVKHKEKQIYGVLFHPEVRNFDILEAFAKL
jgi:GMP synthase-like glutamine amidotransferase